MSITETACTDFHKLYRMLNGIPLKGMDEITDPFFDLCRDHELAGFMHGIQMGTRLAQEAKIRS